MTKVGQIPGEFGPEIIGKVITIQTFPRNRSNPNELVLEKMEKFVGVLQAYSWSDKCYSFKIKGLPEYTVDFRTEYSEVFIHEPGTDA